MTTNWWESYFAEWLPIQTHFRSNKDVLYELLFVHKIATRYACRAILDVPSGNGQLALNLSKKGYEVCAIDYNANIIDHLRQQHADKTNIRFGQGDMRQLPFDNAFDMATCTFRSFGYFDDVDNERFLASVHRSLRNEGIFLLETHVLETILPIWTEREYWQANDHLLLEQRTWDIKHSRMNGLWTFVAPNGARTQHSSSVRIYGLAELLAIANKIGFSILKLYGSYGGEPFQIGSEHALLLLRKQRSKK